jgi:protein PhnA
MTRTAANGCRRPNWPRSKRAAESAVEVRDAVGNLLADGDSVTLIKDLTVKGAGQTLKQGTRHPSRSA